MNRAPAKGIVLHVAVAIGFAALAVVWSFPLVLHLSSHLPGGGIGDNAIFLWNFWWMRTALASGTDFFHTTYLFAPAGADLTLHTHVALPAFVGATLLRDTSVTTALNVTTLASLALNGFCAYLLAWRVVRQRGAAILAGTIYATSPYIAAHLNGHFNLTTAWTIPLFALGAADAVRGSLKWAVFAGVVLGATAYIDYYYVVYEMAFACCVLLLTARQWSVETGAKPPSTRWLLVLISAIALDLVLVAGIGVTGGFDVQVGSLRVSAHDTFNLLQVLWLLMAIALWVRFRPKVGARPRDDWSWGRAVPALAVMTAIFLLLSAPLLRNGIQLLVHGQYVTQQYDWRNAPIGIDILTLVLGNPFHSLWGGALQQLYARIGIDLIESGAWLGVAPLVLAVFAWRRCVDPIIRQWAALGAVFFVWALGSHIHAAGQNTGFIMPEVLLRYVPIAANARMPGRAMLIVYLALAVLAATGVTRLRWRRPTVALLVMTVLVLADFSVAPFPIASARCPAVYQVLKDRPERGALAELPLSMGDGFGELTPVDHLTLVCQTIHGRPLVGGVLARLPTNVLATYRADPLFAAWLRLSGAAADVAPDGAVPDSTLAAQRMKADGIAFVMLNRQRASAQMREHVEHVLPLRLIAEDDERALYGVVLK